MKEKSQFEDGLDAYWHLHEEDFEAPFIEPLLTAESLVFMGGRDVQSLNGDWRFTINPQHAGYLANFYNPPSL